MNDDLNRRLHEALGKCWHRGFTTTYRTPDTLADFKCYNCGLTQEIREYGEEYNPNPDYCADPRLVIEVMMEREDWLEFAAHYLIVDVHSQEDGIQIDLIMDKTGKLAKLAIEWLGKK